MASDPSALLQRVAATPTSDVPMDVLIRRASVLRRRRRGTVVASVIGLMIAGSLAVASEWPGSSVPPSNRNESPSPTYANGIQSFPVLGGPSELAVGAGSVWAANSIDHGWGVTRIDEDTGEVQATINTGRYSRSATFGEGYFWALVERGDRRLAVAIDPATNTAMISPLLFETNIQENHDSIAAGGGAAWVAWRGVLSRIEVSPDSSELVVTQTRLPKPFNKGDRYWSAYAVAFGDGAVWVAKGTGAIARIDPATGDLVDEVRHLGSNLQDITAGSSSLWISHDTPSGRHRLFRLDYATGEATKMDVRLGKYHQSWMPRVGGGSLWLARSFSKPGGAIPGENVVEIDESTGVEIERLRLKIDTWFGAAASDTALWIGQLRGNDGNGEVIRVPSQR